MVFNRGYADAYDYIYQDKNYSKECDYLEAIFKKNKYKPKTILDLGCGTGGHALILAQRGYQITGVDQSARMLEIADRKAKAGKLKINYREGDITKISMKQKYDAVISMFAVMSYQITNSAIAAVCQLAKKSLNPGGLFLFDCWHGPAVLADRPVSRKKNVDLNNGDEIIRFTESQIDVINQIVRVFFRIKYLAGRKPRGKSFKNNPVIVSRQFSGINGTEEIHLLRFLFSQEIKYFLEVAGFAQIDFYPFLELKRKLSEKDWNMMVSAKI